MLRIKSFFMALYCTRWFFIESWKYVVTKSFRSKVEYFTGVLPAWIRFTFYTYQDCLRAQLLTKEGE